MLSALGKCIFIFLLLPFYFTPVSTSLQHIRVLNDAVSSGSAVFMLMGQCKEHGVTLRIRDIICTHWHGTEWNTAHTQNVFQVKSHIGWRLLVPSTNSQLDWATFTFMFLVLNYSIVALAICLEF